MAAVRLASIEVANLRCLRKVALALDDLTALVGANGTGKSSVIRALEFFFGELKLDAQDCWNDCHGDISVTIAFEEFDDEWRARLSPWLDADGRLRLTKRRREDVLGRVSEAFVALRRQHGPFVEIRSMGAMQARKEYRKLREANSDYSELPPANSFAAVQAALQAWESAHPGELEELPEEDAVTVGRGGVDIGELVRFYSVPAVRDASQESADGRPGVFRRLIELLVRSELRFEAALQALQAATDAEYKKLVHTDDVILKRASKEISAKLSALAPGSRVSLDWDETNVQLPKPSVHANLAEHGYQAEVGRQGHGVQRAYLLALLQAFAERKAQGSANEPLTVLAIEEPELYQHPTRARTLAGVFHRLTKVDGANMQILYATHSPFFVSLDIIRSLRLLRVEDGGAPSTSVESVDLAVVARELWTIWGEAGPEFTAETLIRRLRPFADTPLGEGLFATAVVLVEGPEDRALILGSAKARGHDLEALGIAVLPVGGKTCLDHPLLLLRQLGIPIFACFDADASKGTDGHPESNQALLRALGGDVVEFPATQVHDTWACFGESITQTVGDEIGIAEYNKALDEVRGELGLGRKEGRKNAIVLTETLRRLSDDGRESATLNAVVERVIAMV